MDPMDAEVEDEEASPKTLEGKKKESSRDKSEREYARFLHDLDVDILILLFVQEENL
jgi:hypothetical protein